MGLFKKLLTYVGVLMVWILSIPFMILAVGIILIVAPPFLIGEFLLGSEEISIGEKGHAVNKIISLMKGEKK